MVQAFDVEQQLYEERLEEIHTIEQTMHDLTELSKDCATLVTMQGDMIDNIEDNMH
jgi:t-SNARE complex subunit (syntaxin)